MSLKCIAESDHVYSCMLHKSAHHGCGVKPLIELQPVSSCDTIQPFAGAKHWCLTAASSACSRSTASTVVLSSCVNRKTQSCVVSQLLFTKRACLRMANIPAGAYRCYHRKTCWCICYKYASAGRLQNAVLQPQDAIWSAPDAASYRV